MAPKFKYPIPLPILTCDVCNKELKYSSRKSQLTTMKKLGTSPKYCGSCAQKQYTHTLHTDEYKRYMSKLMTGRKVTWGDKIRDAHWSKDPTKRNIVTAQISAARANELSSNDKLPSRNGSFKHGYYESSFGQREYYRSSYELARMKDLDSDPLVVNWTTRHGIKIPYMVDDNLRYYIPDFRIEYSDGRKVIEEVKGWISEPIRHKKKCAAAKKWCKENGYVYNLNFMEHK